MEKIVTKELLDLHDKYDEDLGLLHELWASKKDRNEVKGKQVKVMYEYIDLLCFSRLDTVSKELRRRTLDRIEELEKLIEDEVVSILRERHKS